MALRWLDLGDPGLTYTRSYLESNEAFGKLLGRLLLDRFPWEGARARVLAPADRDVADLVDLERGGVLPKMQPDWREQAGGRLAELMGSSGAAGLFVEGAMPTPTDGWIARRPDTDTIFFCGDSVLEFFDRHDDAGRALQHCGGAMWDPDVALVAEPPPSLGPPPNRGFVDADAVVALASAARAIIIGVWDGEGLLFCEA